MQIETASSWDSYKQALVKVLGEFKPKTVFEWGPGVSTLIMQDFPSVQTIDTVEHDRAWWGKWKDKFGNNIKLYFQDNMNLYYKESGRLLHYDLIFVDGRERENCLVSALHMLNPEGIVILHDAERPSYKPFIEMYKFIFYEDDGHTVILTNSEVSNERLENVLCLTK